MFDAGRLTPLQRRAFARPLSNTAPLTPLATEVLPGGSVVGLSINK